ncbi:MAG: hypothetical protein AB1896_08675 [Thermodesulfobacteriota bacterium]
MVFKMEKMVEELKGLIRFKDSTQIGDVVLLVKEPDQDNLPPFVSFAHVNGFDPDPSKRDEWWFVRLTLLTLPPQPVTFILQTPHFTGQEIFTMGGKKVFLQALDFEAPARPEPEPETLAKKKGGLTLIKT